MAGGKGKKEQKEYRCPVCEACFSSKKRHTQHVKTHSDKRPFICQFCAKGYKSRPSLDGHILSRHVDKLSTTNIVSYFKCKLCNARFISQSKLTQHQTQNIRDSGRDLRCEHCSETFLSTCSYRKHIDTHCDVIDECKPYACQFCNKKFLRKRDCTVHEKRHSDSPEKSSFPCGYCNKTFAYKSYVVVHMKLKHREQYLKTYTPGDEAGRRRSCTGQPLRCDTCGKVFATVVRLEEHSAIHSGDKQNLCEYCGKLFAKRSNLRAHLFTHTGEKPHQCRFCEKRFTAPEDLYKHERSHTGEKPYKCDKCQRAFTQIGGLRNHEKRQHSSKKEVQNKTPAHAQGFFEQSINVATAPSSAYGGVQWNQQANYFAY